MKKIEVVAAVIKKEDCIFATQRGYGEFKGWWEFPGGKIEVGENHKEALIREIKEELNTNIVVKDLLKTVNYQYPNFFLTMHCYWCEIVEGELELLEHQDAKWLTADELDQVEWLPADIDVVNELKYMI